jgi:hypothetical protein
MRKEYEMNKSTIITLVSVGLVISLGVIGFMLNVSYNNQTVAIETQKDAVQKDNANIYDMVWKTIQQKAAITDKYQKDFRSIYVDIMKARYDGKDAMFLWIKEQNPNFSADMYKDLSHSIEALREKFRVAQSKLIDIKREHDKLRLTFPSSLFVGDRGVMEINIITSTKTKAVFTSGIDDDVDLFNKEAKK